MPCLVFIYRIWNILFVDCLMRRDSKLEVAINKDLNASAFKTVETIHLVLPESPFTRVTQPGALTLMAPDYPSRAVLRQLWADRMQHKVIMLVVAQFEILKISQKWVNHQNENYFGPGWGEEARALLALPFSFQVNQWGTSFPSATGATQQKHMWPIWCKVILKQCSHVD